MSHGTGAKEHAAQETVALGVWGWSQGGRRLESRGGVRVGIGSGRGGNQGRWLSAEEQEGESLPFNCWRAGSQVLERGSQSSRAAVPCPLQVLQ